MSDLIKKAIDDLNQELVRVKDNLITDAISYELQSNNWKIEDINGRCELVTSVDMVETFVFDGKPMVNFYPVKSKQSNSDIGTDLKYQILYKD